MSFIMIQPNMITPLTNKALREAAEHYFGAVATPCYVEEANGFMSAYTDLPLSGTKTLVEGTPESFTVTVAELELGWSESAMVHLGPASGGVASIMALRHGPQNTITTKVERALTEQEGEELCMDLYGLIARIPVDHRRRPLGA